ncbi:uncharacterized protein BJ171DRAFT_170014 [Polychytrium aggregatum]|uniref:uncharacterized protein n=1 Tax=Polychytrium aggregatum TaxID=110093 RepID=UPI0022FE54E8|nr:uncharacterized protein BJ171DRAFT_170014 [Polychytrium aggregatum]KAI9208890.1 hypothetical protein BJ171DRAFT_170014 [Polychytrium aggregatum]
MVGLNLNKNFKKFKNLTAETLANTKAILRVKSVQRPKGVLVATESFKTAVESCKQQVDAISRKCRSINRRFVDEDFDVTTLADVSLRLLAELDSPLPESFGRIKEVFEKPVFIDGVDYDDIGQGSLGDCWFMAALASTAMIPEHLARLCVARDEQVGVYGFVFFHDGEWEPVIIDDRLFISKPDWESVEPEKRADYKNETTYRRLFQTGSDALYYAKSTNQNETWLPLMEKAYAKIHGDYQSLSGGLTGEAIEDLTGGISFVTRLNDILDTDLYWKDEFSHANRDRLFSAYIMKWSSGFESVSPNGLVHTHAYTVVRTVEAKGRRFLMLRNPWGKTEWNGRWSDGSPEWTAEWITILGHKFGDDGAFWMEYDDFLREFTHVDRTRLFDGSWFLDQQWLQLQTEWPAVWSESVFGFEQSTSGPAVVVLSQLDTRYFQDFQGTFDFDLQFQVYQVNDNGERELLDQSQSSSVSKRSVSIEFANLEAGTYQIDTKIIRVNNGGPTVEQVISEAGSERPKKLLNTIERFNQVRSRAVNIDETDGQNATIMAKITQSTPEEITKLMTNLAAVRVSVSRARGGVRAQATDSADDDGDKDEDGDKKEDGEDQDQADGQEDGADGEAPNIKFSDGKVIVGFRVYSKDAGTKIKPYTPPTANDAADDDNDDDYEDIDDDGEIAAAAEDD